MHHSAPHFVFRRNASWLVIIGLFAVVLRLMAGGDWARPVSSEFSDAKYSAVVCTSHGILVDGSSPDSGNGPLPASVTHDCCKLCAGGGPLLVASIALGVPPVPTFAIPQHSRVFAPPTPVVHTAHAPRGPPARV